MLDVALVKGETRAHPNLRARSTVTSCRDSDTRLGEETADPLERAGLEAVVRERSPLLAFEQPRLDELLQVMAHGRLADSEERLELADAHGLAVGLQEAVEDLQPMAVAKRLEQTLELGGVLLGKGRTCDRRAALDERSSFTR